MIGMIGKAFLFVSKIAIGAIWSIAKAMFAAMAANPILVAIALVITALGLIAAYWDEIRAVAEATWEIIKNKVNSVWDEIKAYADEKWKALTDDIINLWVSVTSVFRNLWSGAVDKVTGFLNSMIPQGVKDFFDEIAAFFGSDSEKNINVNVNGNLAALQQPTGSRAYSNSQTNNITVNAANNPKAVANSVVGVATSLNNGYRMANVEAR